MAISIKDLDSAFQGVGQKAGTETWHIENSRPVPVSQSSYGKFFTGDAYIILKTTALKSGTLRYDIYYWLGKDTSQEEAGSAAIKAIELDAALGGRSVQYREVQGYETEKFLSYFRPCIIPQEGRASSGFGHTEITQLVHETRLYDCKGSHVVHVKQVPFARTSLNHDDVFILDTRSKIFQFNGSNSSIQERARALDVVQLIRDRYHNGKCDVAAIEDGKLMATSETGEFWSFFGGFAPLPRKAVPDVDKHSKSLVKLHRIEKGQLMSVKVKSLAKDLLDTNKCYLLDCGSEFFVWLGRNTSLEERKRASTIAEELLRRADRRETHMIRFVEGYETVIFRSKFDTWTQANDQTISQEGRGKVAALLKRQGVNVNGLTKAAPVKEEHQSYIDCTGNLQVWRVNGGEKTLIASSDQSKFYSGDCYIFQYTYNGEDKDEYVVGTWLGSNSIEEERAGAITLAGRMVDSLKSQAAQALIYEGGEPIQFFSIFQSFTLLKGGLSSGYKKHIADSGIADKTYSEESIALFRVQGSGPENMQAIQVEPVASSLNSSYCYILHSGNTIFTWSGSLTTMEDQELVERQLDIIKPNSQSKPQKEGSESEHFWSLLGGKCEYKSQKIVSFAESDPHLFVCDISKGDLKVMEVFSFSQDDLMTEDIFILDCRCAVFVWVGFQVDSNTKIQVLDIGQKYIEQDFLKEKLSRGTPIFIVTEGNEPAFFTRFFTWDSAKSTMHGNSFQRKLAFVKDGVIPTVEKPQKVYGGRSSVPDKFQRSRSMSFNSDRVRVRGRSPAFNALAANFENPTARNLSTPPPLARRVNPTADSSKLAPRSTAIAALSASFERAGESVVPSPQVKAPHDADKRRPPIQSNGSDGKISRNGSLTIEEDPKEDEVDDDGGLPTYPYERLKTTSADPASDIDVKKRETYLSLAEFREKFGMTKDAFFKLPKWRQNKLKVALQLF